MEKDNGKLCITAEHNATLDDHSLYKGKTKEGGGAGKPLQLTVQRPVN